MFLEYVKMYSEQFKAQKDADIKWLEDEYKAKTVEFKKTMTNSIQFISKQNLEKVESQKWYSELVKELNNSKAHT